MVFAVLPGIQKANVAHFTHRFVCKKDAVRPVTPKSVWTNGAARQQTCVVQKVAARRRISVVELAAVIRTRLAVTIHVATKGKNAVETMGINAATRQTISFARKKHSTRSVHISLTRYPATQV